jgi:hypothetical protein
VDDIILTLKLSFNQKKLASLDGQLIGFEEILAHDDVEDSRLIRRRQKDNSFCRAGTLLHNGEACRLHILTIAAFLQLARGEHSLAAQCLPPVVHGVLPNRQPGASIVCDETLFHIHLLERL